MTLNYILGNLGIAIIVLIILFLYAKYSNIHGSNKKPKTFQHIALAILTTVLLFITCQQLILQGTYQDTIVKITATGMKNIKSNSSEVWITSTAIDGKPLDLSNFSHPDSWVNKDNAIVSYQKQPSVIELTFKTAGNIQITFLKHAWSGITKIQVDNTSTQIDLYDKNSSSLTYSVKGKTATRNFLERAIFYVTGFVFLFSLSFALIGFVLVNLRFFPVLYGIMFIVIFGATGQFTLPYIYYIFLLVLSVIIGYYFPQIISHDRMKKYRSKSAFLALAAISLYAAFACVGAILFFKPTQIDYSIQNVMIFLMVAMWLLPIEVVFLYCLQTAKDSISQLTVFHEVNSIGTNGIVIKSFLILSGIWGVYLAACFPAKMSADSLVQWAQATGRSPLNDAFPVFHTLIIRMITAIIPSPALVGSIQLLCMALVVTVFLRFLFNKGIPARVIIAFSFVFVLFPNNGFMVVTLWKDVAYTISLLWLTYVFVKFINEGETFSKNYGNLVQLIFALVMVYLFRHNGVVPYLLSIVVFSIYVILKAKRSSIDKRMISAILISVLIILAVKGPIYSKLKVTPNLSGYSYLTMAHSLGAIVYYGGDLSPSTSKFMESIMPLGEWNRLYYPATINPYQAVNSMGFVDQLSETSLKDMLTIYLDSLVKEPGIVIRDRIEGFDLLWDITMPTTSYNFRYPEGIDSPNRFGFKSNSNLLNTVFNKIGLDSSEIQLFDVLFWRVGVYNILLLLIAYSWWFNGKRANTLILVPWLGNVVSLVLTMGWQDYRYVYFSFFIFCFILLVAVVDLEWPPAKVRGVND